MNTIPDLIGRPVDEGRKILLSSVKGCTISIEEIHSFKDKEFYNISDGTIVNQKYLKGRIILYIGFFDPPK